MTSREYVAFRARELGFEPYEILSRAKRRSLYDARMTIARELRGEPFGMSYPEIARALGRSDHSCIWWGLRGGRKKETR